ncbi:MAG: TerB family tellurite resistance protein, partial [Rhodoferax sp.]|nr:TerB family tellurite resistance protein [Rhodoferax sp.]
TDLFAYTSRINEHFDMPQKLRMIEHMWRVAYADGRLSDHERHVMWRVADLLHIPKGAYVHAKIRAREAAGAD